MYERVAHRLRSAAADLKTAAAEMAAAVDLPMAAHDLAEITTPDVLDAFERYVAAEEDLRRLLDARQMDNEQMITAIRSEIASPEAATAVRSETRRCRRPRLATTRCGANPLHARGGGLPGAAPRWAQADSAARIWLSHSVPS